MRLSRSKLLHYVIRENTENNESLPSVLLRIAEGDFVLPVDIVLSSEKTEASLFLDMRKAAMLQLGKNR